VSTDANEGSYTDLYHGEKTEFSMTPDEEVGELIFRVRAELRSVESGWQTGDLVQAFPPPEAPVVERPEMDDESQVHLQWKIMEGATHYVVEAARDEKFSDIRRMELKQTSVFFQPSASGKYWFRVRAYRGSQSSPPSNIVSVQVRRPTAPTLWPLDPVKADAPFDLSWTGVPGCQYYEVQEALAGDFKSGTTSGTVKVYHPSQKLAVRGRPTGRYYYRVRAVDNHQQPSLWSDPLMVEVT
jgi:hypothetical protein